MKRIISILAASLALMAVSCNVENVGTVYSSEGAANNAVTFLQSVLTDTEISASATSVTVKVARSIANGAQTVNLTSTIPTDDISVPASVSFADGAYEADIVIEFLASMAVGKSYKGDITIDPEAVDEHTSVAKITITLQKAYSWAEYGEVSITDDIIAPWFGTANVTWKVKAEKAEGFEVYRLLDPYGEAFPYNEPGDFTPGAKWVLDCSDPTKVNFDKTFLGFDWGYGEFNIWPLAYGTMVDKVITWPAEGIAINLPTYGSGYTNDNGLQKIDLNL